MQAATQDPLKVARISKLLSNFRNVHVVCRGQAAAFATFTNFGSNFAVSP